MDEEFDDDDDDESSSSSQTWDGQSEACYQHKMIVKSFKNAHQERKIYYLELKK